MRIIIILTSFVLLQGCFSQVNEINEKRECIKCDLSTLDFNKLDSSSKLDLTESILTGTKITDVEFVDVIFNNAIFDNVELSNVTFTGGSLSGAAFKNSKLVNVSFKDNADISAIEFIDGSIVNTDFISANLSAVKFENVEIENVAIEESAVSNARINVKGGRFSLINMSLDDAIFDVNLNILNLRNITGEVGIIRGEIQNIIIEGDFYYGQLSSSLVSQIINNIADIQQLYTDISDRARLVEDNIERLFWKKYRSAKINRDNSAAGYPTQIFHETFQKNNLYYSFPTSDNDKRNNETTKILINIYDSLNPTAKEWFDKLETGEMLKIQDDLYRQALNKSRILFCIEPTLPKIPSHMQFISGNDYTKAYVLNISRQFSKVEQKVAVYEECVNNGVQTYDETVKTLSQGLDELIFAIQSEKESIKNSEKLARENKQKKQEAYKTNVIGYIEKFYDIDSLVTKDFLQTAMVYKMARMSERQKFEFATSDSKMAEWVSNYKKDVKNRINQCISAPFFKKHGTKFDSLDADSMEAEFNLKLLDMIAASVSRNRNGDTSELSQKETNVLLNYGFTEQLIIEKISSVSNSINTCSSSALLDSVGLY